MNKQRRNKIQKAIDLLDEVITDEQDAYDNMLENLQESEKSESMDEGLDTLDEAKGLLEELIS